MHDDHDPREPNPSEAISERPAPPELVPEEPDPEAYGAQFEELYAKTYEEIRSELEGRLVVAFVGNVSAGKSSLINALFGREVTEANPISGWTKEIYCFEHPRAPGLVIADTPGLEDVDASVSGRAREFVGEADILVFVLNAAVGCTESEAHAYRELAELERPMRAVINKMDQIRPRDRERFLEHTRRQLGSPELLPVAADPLQGEPEGIDELQDWLLRTAAEQGKELLLAKALRNRRAAAETIVRQHTAAAAATGALPIPGSDYVALTGIQVSMIMRLANLYDVPWTRERAKEFTLQILFGGAGKQLYRAGIQLLKGAGWLGGPFGAGAVALLAGSIAAATTYALGQVTIRYFESDLKLTLDQLEPIFRAAYEIYRKGEQR